MFANACKTNVVQVERPQDLPLDVLREMLERDSVAFVRGLIDPDEVRRCKQAMAAAFDHTLDRPGKGETPAELMSNFQKLSIGGAPQSGVYRPRFMRSMYSPLWCDDIYEMHGIIEKAARARNVLYGLPLDFAIHGAEGGLWTAARVHHYPAGGGFLVSHMDTVMPKVHEAEGLGTFYQLIVVMSQRGEDFESGGGFVEKDGERLYFEAEAQLGDIAIYDSRTQHGVEDVDPHLPYDPASFRGRVAGFVTLYKDLRPSAG